MRKATLNNYLIPFPMTIPCTWKHTTNIYEVNLRQYTPEGTFKAFAAQLSRLKDMGVETLWFMPITPIAQKNKKGSLGSQYAAADYTSINPEFGSLKDFKDLVEEAHSMGFKIIIDWVANHTGWDHVWTLSNPEFYRKNPDTGDFQTASGMDDIIELNYSNHEMRLAMIEAMKFWVREINIDGFRCDLAAWVQLDFWQQARTAVEQLKPLFWLGEFDELDHPEYGKVFDASYVWNWMHRTKDFCDGNLSFVELKDLLVRYSEIGDGSMRAWFTSNHDENTWNGTEYEKYGIFAKALAVFSVTWNGVPLIYNGQEIPLRTKRLEFFEKDTIPWTDTFELHDFYKKLLTLKSTHPALRGGDSNVCTYLLKTAVDDRVLVYMRVNGEASVLTVISFSREQISFNINGESLSGTYTELFTGSKKNFSSDTGFVLEPGGFSVFCS